MTYTAITEEGANPDTPQETAAFEIMGLNQRQVAPVVEQPFCVVHRIQEAMKTNPKKILPRDLIAKTAVEIFRVGNDAGSENNPSFKRTWDTATDASRAGCIAVAEWHLAQMEGRKP